MPTFDACALHLPHKKWAVDAGKPDAHWEEDNYAYLEQWSLRFRDCFTAAPPPDGGLTGSPVGLLVYAAHPHAMPLTRTQITWWGSTAAAAAAGDLFDLETDTYVGQRDGDGNALSFIIPPGTYHGVSDPQPEFGDPAVVTGEMGGLVGFSFLEAPGTFGSASRTLDVELRRYADQSLLSSRSWTETGNRASWPVHVGFPVFTITEFVEVRAYATFGSFDPANTEGDSSGSIQFSGDHA